MQPFEIVNDFWVLGVGPRFLDVGIDRIKYAADQKRSPDDLRSRAFQHRLHIIERKVRPW